MTASPPGNVQPLSLGIIGAGAISVNVHLPVLANMPGTRIAWIADRDHARAVRIGRATAAPAKPADFELMADVVLLAIPVPGREEWLAHFSGRSAAVLVEKPFANSAADHRRWQEMFAPQSIAVGYQRRCHATSLFLEKAIHEGWFGRLKRIIHREGGRDTRGGMPGYFDRPASDGGGITKNLGCHGIDLAFHLTRARDFAIREHAIEFDGGCDRRVSARIDLHGVTGVTELDIVVSSLDRQISGIRFEFEHATIGCPIQPSGSVSMMASDGNAETIDVSANGGATTSNQAFFLEWKHFLDGIRSGVPGMMAASTAFPAARVMDALLISDNAGLRA